MRQSKTSWWYFLIFIVSLIACGNIPGSSVESHYEEVEKAPLVTVKPQEVGLPQSAEESKRDFLVLKDKWPKPLQELDANHRC